MEGSIKYTRTEILEKAMETDAHGKNPEYGSPENSFDMIASLWEVYLERKFGITISLSPEEVAVMMCLFSLGKITAGGYQPDTYADLAGYAACAGEIAGRYAEIINGTVSA